MEIHYKIIGVILIFLALIHVGFSRYFNWKKELQALSLINREMMIIHTFFIAVVVLLMGLLCAFYSFELTETKFGKIISLGLGIFWSLRLIVQFFGYSSALWKGKTFETMVHIVFTILWIYMSLIFIYTYLK